MKGNSMDGASIGNMVKRISELSKDLGVLRIVRERIGKGMMSVVVVNRMLKIGPALDRTPEEGFGLISVNRSEGEYPSSFLGLVYDESMAGNDRDSIRGFTYERFSDSATRLSISSAYKNIDRAILEFIEENGPAILARAEELCVEEIRGLSNSVRCGIDGVVDNAMMSIAKKEGDQ